MTSRTKPGDTRAVDDLLRAHGLRRTDPRVAVLGFLHGQPKPISHAELTDALAPRGLDRVTVYRNLVDLAEAGILVRSDLHGHGLGTALIHRIIEVARNRGLSRLVGSVLRDNTRMLRLVREFGFVAESARGDEVTMVLRL